MKKLRPRTLFGSLVIALVVALVVGRTLRAPLEHKPALEGEARIEVEQKLADDEPAARRDAIREFPGDRWSQDDAFHAREDDQVRDIVSHRGVALESVLDVLDESLRAGPHPQRPGTVAPCKPRPSYD